MPARLVVAQGIESVALRYHRLPSEVAESDTYNLEHMQILGAAGYFAEPAQSEEG